MNEFTSFNHDLKVGDFISLPINRKRTFWEWLTRRTPTIEQKVFKIMAVEK